MESIEPPKKSLWKFILSILLLLAVFNILAIYWFIPFRDIDFETPLNIGEVNYNFSLADYSKDMQFYPQMRFPDSKISYEIINCPLGKKNEMEQAFNIIANETILEFYEKQGGEILVTCSSSERLEGGLFIAGEGGPSNVTLGEKFSIILNGKIQLLKESSCMRPNIATHELLHVLGFNHSTNENNIMYPVSNCKQIISEDMTNLINDIYAIPGYADVSFENVSGTIHGRYLDSDIQLKNVGLKDSEAFKLKIYSEDKLIQTLDLDQIELGSGIKISLKNIKIPTFDVSELRFVAETTFNELDLSNNEIKLKVGN